MVDVCEESVINCAPLVIPTLINHHNSRLSEISLLQAYLSEIPKISLSTSLSVGDITLYKPPYTGSPLSSRLLNYFQISVIVTQMSLSSPSFIDDVIRASALNPTASHTFHVSLRFRPFRLRPDVGQNCLMYTYYSF